MDYNKDQVLVHGRTFVKYISADDIAEKVKAIAIKIQHDYQEEWPIFVILFNGAYVFAADLLRHFPTSIHTHFVKLSSYHEMDSSGKVEFDRSKLNMLIGKKVVLIEDIIDTGITMHAFCQSLQEIGVAEWKICSLLCKPSKMKHNIAIDYLGYEIENAFVIGYGLDYDEHGRNLPHIYQLAEE